MTKQTAKKSHNKQFRVQSLAIRLMMLAGKILPRHWGLGLATMVGSFLGNRKADKMVRAIRANQYVIHNKSLFAEALDQIPATVFQSAARCFFDYFHYLPRPSELQKVVSISPEARAALERIQARQPTVVVCPHLSNFELFGYALTLQGIDIQVLSFPNPNTSYKLQNRLRKDTGINITPMTLSAFRQARVRLQDGGSILTGLDRPMGDPADSKYQLNFFGHPANLPVAYVRMALEANAPVIIMAATSQADGTYRLVASEPVWMTPNDDLETEIVVNAEKVLQLAQTLILNHADQWAMFYPIWPQYLGV
jgi:phosphatidylinositol dimannoside acyltransferase